VRAKPGAMSQHETSRTLVKSPPELWAECSDASSLARHLGQFGEIRITKLEPETSVAWEGARGSGTVRLEPSGWGTKVILTAVVDEEPRSEVVLAPEPAVVATEPAVLATEPALVATEPALVATEPAVEPVVATEPPAEPVDLPEPAPLTPTARRRRFARLRAFFRGPEPVESASDTDTVEPESPAAAAPAPDLAADPAPPPAAAPPPDLAAPESSPTAVAQEAEAALTAALDSLGQAHHRPYSRA
jgi:hypothetical protein